MTLPQQVSGEDVVIIGAGMTPVGEYWETSIRELALQAISMARSGLAALIPDAIYVANMLAPALSAQTQLGPLISDFAGLRGVESLTIEAAGASGGAAIRQAFLALKSGVAKSVLVIGVEKVTDRVGSEVDSALATSTDADYEAIHGITPTSQAALLMRRYLYENDAPEDALAGFSLTAHQNAVTNPNAMFRQGMQLKQYVNAPMISAPLNMFDAAPLADGAAALLLARADAIPSELTAPAVRIVASSMTSTTLALHDRPDILRLSALESSVNQALEMGDLRLEDLDLFELHDQYSIMAALALEAAGFAPRGRGWELARNGAISRSGTIPISTFGGSKARGDSGGATGVYQVAEITRQLQGLAGENQVPDARYGMAQCVGGVGSTAATHILARVEP